MTTSILLRFTSCVFRSYNCEYVFQVGQAKVVKQTDKDQVLLIGAGITLHESVAAAEVLKAGGSTYQLTLLILVALHVCHETAATYSLFFSHYWSLSLLLNHCIRSYHRYSARNIESMSWPSHDRRSELCNSGASLLKFSFLFRKKWFH
jgi:transketolase